MRGLRMLEMLLAAGHRPIMALQDMVKAPSIQIMAVYDSRGKRLENVQQNTTK